MICIFQWYRCHKNFFRGIDVVRMQLKTSLLLTQVLNSYARWLVTSLFVFADRRQCRHAHVRIHYKTT
jgi:hypothetical protein